MTIYVCEICRYANAARNYRCRACGTIPKAYSMTGSNESFRTDEFGSLCHEVVAAHGAERQTDRRAHKVYFRTVKLDYYADASQHQK